MERFLFDRHRANERGAKLAAVVEERRPGISSVDRRRLDDGARALAAIEPPQTDVGALRDYVEQLAAAVAAMQSLDDFGSEANQKAWSDLLALQEKWKDAERKLTALRPLRVLESPTRERLVMGSWGTGAFENDAAADFVAGLIEHVHRVTSKKPVRPRWRSADTYEEARAAGNSSAGSRSGRLGGPSLLDVLRALAHIRGDADWLGNWNAPRSIAAASTSTSTRCLRRCAPARAARPRAGRKPRRLRLPRRRSPCRPGALQARARSGGRRRRRSPAVAQEAEAVGPVVPADADCSHDKLELGFDHLNGEARQCPDCGVWFSRSTRSLSTAKKRATGSGSRKYQRQRRPHDERRTPQSLVAVHPRGFYWVRDEKHGARYDRASS